MLTEKEIIDARKEIDSNDEFYELMDSQGIDPDKVGAALGEGEEIAYLNWIYYNVK